MEDLIEKLGNEFGAAEKNEQPDQTFNKKEQEAGNAQFL